jgi:hypothetical protein
VPAEVLAHDALKRLAQADPEDTCRRLGLDDGREVVQGTLVHLREAVDREPRPDVALQLLHRRVVEAWPEASPQRRTALLTLMMARGTARQHVPLGFDAALMDDLE